MFSASSSAQFGVFDLGYRSTKKFKLMHRRYGFLLNWKQNTVLYVHPFRPQKDGGLRFASISEHVCDRSCLCDHRFNLYEVSRITTVPVVFDFGICFTTREV